MKCADFEIRLCEYLDGSLTAAAGRELEEHASGCAVCAALAADSKFLAGFIERVPAVEAPPELITNILYRTQPGSPAWRAATAGWGAWFRSLLGPRFAMSMAMTVLSVSMLYRVAGVKVRQLEVADLNPVKIWRTVDGKAQQLWAHGVKVYQNVRFLYEIQSQLRELAPASEPPESAAAPDDRRLTPADKQEKGP